MPVLVALYKAWLRGISGPKSVLTSVAGQSCNAAAVRDTGTATAVLWFPAIQSPDQKPASCCLLPLSVSICIRTCLVILV